MISEVNHFTTIAPLRATSAERPQYCTHPFKSYIKRQNDC